MRIRPAAVAGFFYPADADTLRAMIDGWLAQIPTTVAHRPKALIAPHAGYVYSGLTAAFGYAILRGMDIRRVALLGPAHRVPFAGIALPDVEAFATPLGIVPLDSTMMQMAMRERSVLQLNDAHVMEHSLEVQLPFLQRLLGEFTLAPMVIGHADEAMVADVLELLWGDAHTLIVISSDLSHYHPYEQARRLDRQTIEQILALKGPISHQQACGATGINGLLHMATRHTLVPRLLDYRNSGDTAGGRDEVVGYTSIAFEVEPCAKNRDVS
ncbi:MAG: AmmeMemoRadiSam system protein B [Zetaproteobacteria bacterium]|nr:MAG: AmmeMemoRadiSam system protein B [Zetaproteobacteria bacterium]